ncbi:MAG TPA: GNAT family N-acetyltransferase [Desulfobacterales bacterium]|nr:GNAT family N-acetyltransferase [Desulfobacterales bacterium]
MNKLSDIQEAYLFVSAGPQGMHTAILCRDTGEIRYRSEDADLDEIGEEEIDWDAWIEIPHRNDLDLGQNLVFEFIESFLPNDYERVQQIFRKRGAYRRFKDFLESEGLLDRWHDFENQREEQALRHWVQENGIELSDPPSIPGGPDSAVRKVSTLVVRAAAKTDIPVMAAVHVATFPRQLDSLAWIECNFKAYPRIAYFVAEKDGELIGFIEWIQKSGFRKEAVLELEQLAVQPGFQGQGIGTALIKESVAQMDHLLKKRNARIKSILVTTRTDNQAQALYRKVLRAEPQAVIKDLYSADEVILLARDIRFEKG